jgi:flagellar biosynthetic protein FlhB
MAEQADDSSKEFEPSKKKLDDLRQKGEIPKSSDLTAAAAFLGFIAIASLFGSQSMWRIARELGAFLTPIGPETFEVDSPLRQFGPAQRTIAITINFLPWFILPAAATLASVLVQRALVFAPQKVMPKLSRISPIDNAKNKFGRQGWFEFLKSSVKLTLVSIALIVFLTRRFEDIALTSAVAAGQSISLMAQLVVEFLWVVVIFYLAVGGLDLLWQHAEHRRKNRMSRQEMTDEHKQSEGDPHMKQQRRQRAQDIASNRMFRDVPSADVVIVNPTHYAIALRWDRTRGTAPVCVAKGVDEIALAIRKLAGASNVPIFSDAPSARAMFAIVDVGAEIPTEHYRAAAAAIRFADTIRSKAQTKWNQN